MARCSTVSGRIFMSRVEAPIITTERFLQSWQRIGTHPNRLVAEFISLQKETHREPDNYYFTVSDNELLDPETGLPILKFIAPGIERTVAENLQNWAVVNEEGNAYWISPMIEGVYPCNKLILHQIAYTGDNEKVVLNTAILFDGELDNPEELRRQFIQTDDEGLAEIIAWIEDYTGKKITGTTYTQSERQQAQLYAQQLSDGVPYDVIARQMEMDNFIGNNPISCPTRISTFSNTILGIARVINISGTSESDQYGSLTFECPHCHRQNKRSAGKLISNCQHCDKDVTC